MEATTWSAQDGVALRDFIKACPHFLPAIKSRVPSITKELTIEARAMSGSERAGADKVIEIIEELYGEQPVGEQSPFMEK